MHDLSVRIRAYREGDPSAFSDIYEASVKRIYDFLFYKTLDETVAQDLVSDTFMKALKSMKHFSGSTEKELFAWLYRIAYNTFVDHTRSRTETDDLEIASETIGHDAGLEAGVDHRSKLEEVLSYLDTLSQDQRDIVIMRIWDDLSYAEISEITGKSVDNCKKIVSRVLSQIQANVAFLFFFFLLMK